MAAANEDSQDGNHRYRAEQSEAGEQGLRVTSSDAETITVEGRVNLDELTMAVVGSLAGGP